MYNARRNPALMQTIVLSELDRQLNPENAELLYDIPDATVPFVYALECGVMETTMAIQETEALMRRLYPRLALTTDELYLHMSGDDYIGRFAVPARTNFELLISYDEIIAKAVPYGDQGLKKLIVPRLTQFSVGGLIFTMQYPIELRVMRHGGVVVEYITDKPSPIETLSTNIVDWRMLVIDRQKIMAITIPVNQFQVTTFQEVLNPSTLFQTSYVFNDKFYYARAFINRPGMADNAWEEILTTHTDLVYDPQNLTVVFKVVGNKLEVSIPTIYTNTGVAIGDIRVDIYTTQGIVDMDLSTFRTDQFSYNLNSIDDDTTFTAPLSTFNMIRCLSRERASGGADTVDFVTLRDQVINNTLGLSQLPITNVQLQNNLNRRGYDIVSNIDNITNRQFLAARKLSQPQGLNVESGAGVVMSQLKFDMESLAGSVHVSDNGERITIKPTLLYKFDNGRVLQLADAEIDRLINSSAEAIAREANSSRFVYSPFHNVLDATTNNFDMRPYYLENPTIEQKIFVGENDTAQLQAGIDIFDIEKIETGYRVTVKLESGEQFKQLTDDQVVLQIGYQPPGEVRWASVNGTYIGKEDNERVYQFDIDTNWDINSRNNLYTTNMTMFDLVQNNFSTSLECNLDVTILVVNSTTPGYQPNEIDAMVQTHLLPNQFMVVNRERLQTVLGYDMTKLWRRSRTVLSEESYKRWEYDVMDFWEKDVYKTDEYGNIVITILPDGSLDYEVEHHKGDPKLDQDGVQIVKHRAGDIVLDVNNEPILVEPRKLLREVTLLMIDGLFYFATEQEALNYKTQIPMEFVGWLKNDIELIDSQLLEMCELFLYPTTTYGNAIVTVREGQKSTIPIDQAFALSFYLSQSAYTNATIRPSLIENGKDVISTMLNRKTISLSDIISRLKETSGDDVVAIEANGLGGSNNYSILTVDDESIRLMIRKKLVVLANQELTIEDDVQFNFLRHDLINS